MANAAAKEAELRSEISKLIDDHKNMNSSIIESHNKAIDDLKVKHKDVVDDLNAQIAELEGKYSHYNLLYHHNNHN